METHQQIRELAIAAKRAAGALAIAPRAYKDAVLLRAAEGMLASQEAILRANAADLRRARETGLAPAMLDRLKLDAARLSAVAEGVRQIALLPDPVGAEVDRRRLSNGLKVNRMRVPLGLIGIIYESRPNVTADAAALCIKSGNGVLLRGGKEAFETNRAIAAVFAEALSAEGFAPECAALLPTTDRAGTLAMIQLDGILDVVIPRGGEGLIRFVSENSRVPVIRHYKGVCHVYVDAGADLAMATSIALNAKVQRPGVCNAMETLLVDRSVAEAFLPELGEAMVEAGVRLVADAAAREWLPSAEAATDADWDEEYLALVLSVAVVDGLDGAIAHIAAHGSHHTEAIVTGDEARAERFLREVDASLVLVNASTRFNDGFQLGLGAEMGISTSKLHAYGAMGLEELCTLKWVGRGTGQIREG